MSAASFGPDLGRIGGRALLEVLATLLSLPAIEVKSMDAAAAGSAGAPILATVELTGARVSGAVHLRIPLAFAERAAGLLHGENGTRSAGDTELDDLAGELCNMVAGRLASQMCAEGYPCRLGTPGVVRGSRSRLAPEPGTDLARTDWACQGHQLTLEMRFRYRPT